MLRKIAIVFTVFVVVIIIATLATGSGGEGQPKESPAAAADASTQPAESPSAATAESSEPSESPSAAPAEPEIKIGNGTHRVGADVAPGIYVAEKINGSCYWARLSGLGGTLDEILANDNTRGHAIVEISDGDAAFQSRGCGDWVPVEKAASRDANSHFGEGAWRAGADVAPGTWQSSSQVSCYWARLSGFSGTLDHIIANDNVEGNAIVQIGDGDAGFVSRGCGDWTRAE